MSYKKVEREIMEVRKKSMTCLRKPKEELALACTEKRDDKLTQMLNAANRIEYNGKSLNYFIDIIKRKQKKTMADIKKLSGNMKQKIDKLKKRILYTQVKTRQKTLINRHSNTNKDTLTYTKTIARSVKPNKQWVTTTDTKKSIKLKEELLEWLKKEDKACDPKKSTRNQQLTTRTPQKKILSSDMKIRVLKKQPKKSVVYLDKRFNLIKTRYTDYSLAISSMGSSVPKSYSSIDNPKLYTPPTYSLKSIETFASDNTGVKTPYLNPEEKL